jgi:hypothetical protein
MINHTLVKANEKSSLCLTKHQDLKMYGRVEVYLHAFLNSAPEGVSCQLHAPAALHKVPLI